MKKVILTAVVLALASAMIAQGEPNRPMGGPMGQMHHGQFDPNKVIDRIAERDPEKAEELRKLKQDDPEKFREEMRNMWRERMEERRGEGMEMRPGEGMGPEGMDRMESRPEQEKGQGMRDKMHRRMDVRENLEERHNEYIKFLEQNYPQEAAELAIAKDKQPELYMQKLRESLEKYGKIARASKDNPELAAVLKEDVTLKEQSAAILKDLKAATDENKKKELTEKLRDTASKRFDLIVKQKELRYQDMNKKLAELEKQIKTQQSELEKLKAKKEQEVNNRVNELVSQNEKMQWD